MRKSSNSKHVSNARRLYILVGITLPLAILTIVLASREGYQLIAGTFGVASASWSIFALYSAWKFSERQKTDNTYRTAEVTPRHRRLVLLEKTSCLLLLLSAVALLFIVIIGGSRLYLALGASWWIMVSSGHLFYVSLLRILSK